MIEYKYKVLALILNKSKGYELRFKEKFFVVC